MALMEALVDDFSQGIDGWSTDFSSNPAEVLNQHNAVYVYHDGSGGDANSIRSVNTYDLTGSYAYVQVRDFGDQSITSHEVTVQLFDGPNAVWMTASNGNLVFFKKIAGVPTNMGSIALDQNIHRWLQIRESAGTIFYDTAPDGVTWTNRWSFANPFAVTALAAYLASDCWQAESTGSYAIFDNFNTPDVFAVPTADNTWVVRTETNTAALRAETSSVAVVENTTVAVGPESAVHEVKPEAIRVEVT